MKHLIIGLLLVFGISSCKKKTEVEPQVEEPTETEPPYTDNWFPGWIAKNDSVGILEGREIALETYHTRIDTITNNRFLQTYLRSISLPKDSIVYTWFVNGNIHKSLKTQVIWYSEPQYWIYEDHINVDLLSAGNQISLKAELRNTSTNKKKIKEALYVIKRTNRQSDIFNVRFGMTKAEVKSLEMNRLFGSESISDRWTENSPNYAYIHKSSTFDGSNGFPTYSLYEFKDDELVRVTEALDLDYFPSDKKNEAEKFQSYLTKIGLKDRVIFEEPFGYRIIIANKSWTRNGLKLSIGKKSFSEGNNKRDLFSLTYEPAP